MSSRKSKKQSATKSSEFSYDVFPTTKDSHYTLAYAKKCVKNASDNELCRHMPPTALENIQLSIKNPRFNPQMTSKTQIRKTLVRRGGKTKKNKTKGKTRKHRR